MMLHFVTKVFTVLSLSLVLISCQTGPMAPTSYSPIHVGSGAPYTLDVGKIDIVEEYRSPMVAPYVEHTFPVTPVSALKTWVNDRLMAGGKSRYLRVVVKNASVVEKKLPRTEGIKGVFTKDQAEQYEGHLDASLEIYGTDPLFPEAEIKVSVSRSRTLTEGISLNERQSFYYQLTKDLISDFNAEADRNIGQYFSKYMIYK